MEARPSGKNVRRLSLLSGGERSLTALAFLFAVFRARPSPFYLMDEVEAALDDVNLHRFLDLVHEFRDEAQLLIVSHQKRTMEAADCLYGVSMPPGGSSRVVSQRVRRRPAGGLTLPRWPPSARRSPQSATDPGLVEACGPEGRPVVAVLDRLRHHRRAPTRPRSPTRSRSRSASSSSCSSRGSWCGSPACSSARLVKHAQRRRASSWRRCSGRASRCSTPVPMPQARRAQRAETIGAVLRSVVDDHHLVDRGAHDPRRARREPRAADRGRRASSASRSASVRSRWCATSSSGLFMLDRGPVRRR